MSVAMATQTPKNNKRSYTTMMMDTPHGMVPMEHARYNDFSPGAFYNTQPPPPPPHMLPSQAVPVLFSNPFPVSPNEYVCDNYQPCPESMGYFAAPRSLSEPYGQGVEQSFSTMSSGSSSCNASIGPATPPPTHQTPHHLFSTGHPTKYPITPSHVVPRQKAKRTATACEECRKRKQKCDGETVCQSCKENKLECKYREVSPTKKDNSMEKLVALIEGFGKSMEALNARLDAMSATVGSIQTRLDQCAPATTEVHA